MTNIIRVGERKPEAIRIDSGDNIIDQAGWTPISGSSANFKSSELVIEADHACVRHSREMLRFALVFVALFCGIGGFLFGAAALDSVEAGIAIGVGLSLGVGTGVLHLMRGANKLYFHKGKGGYFRAGALDQLDRVKPLGGLSDIHGMQIISEYISSADSKGHNTSYRSYELNLILKNKTRLNVMDHGNLDALRQDAQALADFLGVRVYEY